MTYIPVTPFRRQMDAALIKNQHYASLPLPPEGVNKYEVVRELTAARKDLGITDREIAVLQVLLSFHPKTILGGNSQDLLVYPSNVAICERLNGMPCSTIRRHLACLVTAGLILRHDSPNGKRFVKRHGDAPQAFGFDLTPLVARFPEICAHAEAARAHDDKLNRLRRAVSLMRRDLASLDGYGHQTRPDVALWDAFSDLAALTARDLRKQLTFDALVALETRLLAALDTVRDMFDMPTLHNSSISDTHIEQHHQTSNKDTYDSEKHIEKNKSENADPAPVSHHMDRADLNQPNIPLSLVTATCLEIKTYAPDGIRHWHQLVQTADKVRPMMGISPSAWQEAKDAMGPEEASVVLFAILERFSDINSPGGYLRSLTRKAEQDSFSCGPMIMALMSPKAA
ncbi:MAG: plasmid replication protein RepC [Yoonia sp.]|nr:plasmid replication protein RepC [Yoonia sp.]